jgi:hypothetical protein
MARDTPLVVSTPAGAVISNTSQGSGWWGKLFSVAWPGCGGNSFLYHGVGGDLFCARPPM